MELKSDQLTAMGMASFVASCSAYMESFLMDYSTGTYIFFARIYSITDEQEV